VRKGVVGKTRCPGDGAAVYFALMPPFDPGEDHAKELDRRDPLAGFRERFHLPAGTIYMDGNSLGLLSRDAEASLLRLVDEWRTLGVRGWLEAERPWFYFSERLGALAAPLVGAAPDEVMVTGTTTVNIHALVSSFFAPEGRRRKILADELDFPSDIYALRDQLAFRGCDPQRDLVLVPSRDGNTIEEDDIIARMTDEVALVFLPSVLYRSGQLLDMSRLTREAHRRGIVIGFDCAHSVGAVPHRLDEWGVDFAVWCSYKYLNAGPGASAFLYVNHRHFGVRPRISGWFGSRKESQFEMSLAFEPRGDAGRWQISSPGILGSAPLEGALALIREAGIEAIRTKSKSLTSYLVELVDARLAEPPFSIRVGSPRDPERRSGHVALERDADVYRITQALKSRGVVPDFRTPNVMRIAPMALYNSFTEVWEVVQHLVEIIEEGEHLAFQEKRAVVP
jgi:kynureninase